jgi:flagellar biosynthesis/type III secretory pathway chaperone
MGSEVVDKHLELCDDLLQILNEENRMLRHQPSGVDDDLLEQKRSYLPRLDESLAQLKQLHAETPEIIPAVREKLVSAQNKIMRILLLDRENEQLLLKSVLPKLRKPTQTRSLQSIKSIYEKHRIPEES